MTVRDDRGDMDAGSLFAALMGHARVGISFVDRELRFRHVNDALAAINGPSAAGHVGRAVAEVLPELWPALRPLFRRVLDDGEEIHGVVLRGTVASHPGEEREWIADYFPVRGRGGDIIGVGALVSDVTEQRRAQREVARLVDQQLAILAAMPDFFFELAADGTHLSFHAPQQERLFLAPEQFIGRRIGEVLPAEVARAYEAAIARALATDTMQEFEYALDFGTDDRRTFEARMVRKGRTDVLVVVRDVSRQRALEGQFRQAQKMEAIGRLAGGVAHDFNNLLTVISACSAMAILETPDGPVRELLREIAEAGTRAAALTRQLLLFSRQQVLEPRVVDLNAVVSRTDTMLRRLIGADVQLVTTLAPSLSSVRIDPGQLEQVLVNLVVNARDAMPDGGLLTITTREVVVPPRSVPAESDGRPAALTNGRWVALSVSDTGTGMEDAVRARLFEPFFSTKPAGRGTGLGLAVVFGVVRESGGHIDVHTAPGRGTTFTLYFPAVPDAPTANVAADAATVPAGTETILLVEDDESVRGVAARVLRGAGYEVLLAADVTAALSMLEQRAGAVHLLVTDVVMPHRSGRELADEVRARWPEVAVLYISGYTDDEMLRRGVSRTNAAFLQKPFAGSTLATKVRAVLDERR